MAKFLWMFLIFLLLLAGYTTYKLSTGVSLIKPLEENTKHPELAKFEFQNWREFSAPKGKFKVLLPTLPQHAVDNVKEAQHAKTRKYEMYVSEKNDGTIFMISLITFSDPKATQDKEKLMRAMMQDMLASNPKNELKQVNSGKYKGFDSLDYSFANQDTQVDAKTFLVDNTLYMLTRAAKLQNYNTEEFEFFINSFDLPKKTQMSE